MGMKPTCRGVPAGMQPTCRGSSPQSRQKKTPTGYPEGVGNRRVRGKRGVLGYFPEGLNLIV